MLAAYANVTARASDGRGVHPVPTDPSSERLGRLEIAAMRQEMAMMRKSDQCRVLAPRMARRPTTVIDTLAFDSELRARGRNLAHDASMACVAVVFDTPAVW